jgi:high-affinity iron transporter
MTGTAIPYFLYSFGIVFREGLEAFLVVLALVAGARRSGQNSQVRQIYMGAGAAVIVSLIMAWAVQHLLSDDAGDTMEGIFQLFAAATLFYVSSWMTAKSQRRWTSFITAKVEAAHSSECATITLAATAFLAVLREGAETIIFFQALAAGATEAIEKHAVLTGLIAGSIGLAVTLAVLRKLTDLIPISRFFSVSSIVLYALAVVFAGQGIASLQESGLVGATFISSVPTVPMLGLYPTIQTIAPQAFLIAIAVGSFARRRIPYTRVAASPAHQN